MGGLAGAVVVMMMQRNQNMSALTNQIGSMVKQRVNDMKENMIEKGIDLKFSNGFMGSSGKNNQNNQNNQNNKNNKHSGSFSTQKDGLEKVEHLASRDPKVKHEVNDILEQNGQHPI
jgi:hypothetical protein